MTPFGLYLESIRRSHQLQQVQLADLLGVNACYVSSMENGKKGPPSKDVLDRLIIKLDLDSDEQEQLLYCVQRSKKSLRLPDNATCDEYLLMHDLNAHVGSLSSEQISIIRNVMALGNTGKTKSKILITNSN